MKKIIVIIFSTLFAINLASADVKMGITLTGAQFNDAKGSEENRGSVETRSEDLAAAYASIFVEASVLNMFSVGIDYIPYDIEGETVSNIRRTSTGTTLGTNSVSVDISQHATLYALVPLGSEGVFIKAGLSHAEVNINESMYGGSTYNDEEMLGGHIGIGYEKDFSGMFVRAEGGYSEYETVEANSSTGNTRVKAALNGGMHARLSIGKSF